MIEALTFDVGGTLVEGELNRESYQSELLGYLRNLGFRVSPKEYQKVMRSALQKLRDRRRKLLEMKFEEFYSVVLDALGVPSHWEILEEVRAIYGRNFPQTPKPSARETLQELRRVYRLGVITNSMSGVSRDFLKREGLANYFEVIIVSRDVGIRKPDPRIFSLTLQRLGVRPSNAAHVGNSLKEDVTGAKDVGMKAVLVGKGKEPAEVEPDLTVRSITELPSSLRRLV